MADLIERDAVAYKVKSCITIPADNEWDSGYNTAMAEAKQYIQNAPAVNRWISVEDALPELKKDHESDCVLCYCDTGAYAFSTLQENFFGQIGFACEKEDDNYHRIGKVIAWMPLPEPPEVTQE